MMTQNYYLERIFPHLKHPVSNAVSQDCQMGRGGYLQNNTFAEEMNIKTAQKHIKAH